MTDDTPFITIPAGGGPFICPWCAATFDRRFISSDGAESLEEHWLRNPECKANRNTSNATQSKYLDRSPGTLKPVQPGEATLERVAAAARLHRVEDEEA